MKSINWLLALLSTSVLTACGADKAMKENEPKSTSPEPVVKVTPVDAMDEKMEETAAENNTTQSEGGLVEEEDDSGLADESEEEVSVDESVLEEEEETEDAAALIEDPTEALNGSFSYNTKYSTPKGMTDMTVTFMVTDGVVSGVDLSGNKDHQMSVQHQVLYATDLDEYVIGKEVEAIEPLPAIVNGSSLTSPGFNEALAQLKKEA